MKVTRRRVGTEVDRGQVGVGRHDAHVAQRIQPELLGRRCRRAPSRALADVRRAGEDGHPARAVEPSAAPPPAASRWGRSG